MKKILSILLAIMMMVTAFSGCSDEKNGESNSKTEIEGESGITVSALQETFTAVIYDEGENEDFWKNIKAKFVRISPRFSRDVFLRFPNNLSK